MSENKVSTFNFKLAKKLESFLNDQYHEKLLFSGILLPAEKKLVQYYANRANLKLNILGNGTRTHTHTP